MYKFVTLYLILAAVCILTLWQTTLITESDSFHSLIYSRNLTDNVYTPGRTPNLNEHARGKKFNYVNEGSKSYRTSDFSTNMSEVKKSTTSIKEITHIAFLKVHKAASSTMQNIFFRFGLRRDLTFVFTEDPNYFSRSVDSHYPLVKPKNRTGYDILCNHGIFNFSIFSSILPNDTVFLATVREPLSLFISAVNFYTQKSERISYIVKVPGNRLQNLIRKPAVYDRGFFSFTKNLMARDFGFPETENQSRIHAKLEEINDIFKLVLIVELFDESLILMKRFLNWTIQDVLYFPNNVYGKGLSVSDLTAADIAKFKVRNKLDYVLYDFFVKKFKEKYVLKAMVLR